LSGTRLRTILSFFRGHAGAIILLVSTIAAATSAYYSYLGVKQQNDMFLATRVKEIPFDLRWDLYNQSSFAETEVVASYSQVMVTISLTMIVRYNVYYNPNTPYCQSYSNGTTVPCHLNFNLYFDSPYSNPVYGGLLVAKDSIYLYHPGNATAWGENDTFPVLSSPKNSTRG